MAISYAVWQKDLGKLVGENVRYPQSGKIYQALLSDFTSNIKYANFLNQLYASGIEPAEAFEKLIEKAVKDGEVEEV